MTASIQADYLYRQGARDGFVTGFVFTAAWVLAGALVRSIWRGLAR